MQKVAGKIIWTASSLALSVTTLYFVQSLTWLFPDNINIILSYLTILFLVLSMLIIWQR
jgi:hypothetical protein